MIKIEIISPEEWEKVRYKIVKCDCGKVEQTPFGFCSNCGTCTIPVDRLEIVENG